MLHIAPHGISVLPSILNRRGSLPASHPEDGAEIVHGRIYVAPPDLHLLVKQGHIHLAQGPKENRHRPAVDPLFRSAARAYNRRVVGVVLSGRLVADANLETQEDRFLPKCRQNAPTITEADIPSPKASTADGLVVR